MATPEAFLKRNVIYLPVAGIAPAQGMHPAYFYETRSVAERQRPGVLLGVATRWAYRPYVFEVSTRNPNLGVGGAVWPPGHAQHVPRVYPVPIHWIATRFFPTPPPPAAPPPFTWYSLTGGPNLMITQRLTGCTFAIRVHHGDVQVAHIAPNGETGAALHARLDAHFGVGHGYTLYGRGAPYGQGRDVTIIGVRRPAGWQIYAQKMDQGTFKVRSLHRIY